MNLDIESFNWATLFVTVPITAILFLWLKNCTKREIGYVIPFIVFFYMYSGYGYGWQTCGYNYIFFYTIWMGVFSFSLRLIMLGNRTKDRRNALYSFKGKQCFIVESSFFPLFYLFLCFIPLVTEGKLMNLIHLPELDLKEAFQGGEAQTEGGLLYYLKNLVYPFYIVSLYKYRHTYIKLFLFLFLPFYFAYAETGGMGRSTLMAYLIIYLIVVYIYHPKIRRKLVLSLLIGFPFLIIALTWYTYARLGQAFNLSFGDSLALLTYQETSYTTHFDAIQRNGFKIDLLSDYIQWLITLPLPGFLKDSSKDYFFNAIFTEQLYGLYRGSADFSVSLPGIVNEGIFIFGNYLFILHAFIMALFVGIMYRCLRYKEELFLFLFCSVFLASLSARAGSVSSYSWYLKGLLIYVVVMYFIRKSPRPYIKE